MHLQFPPALIYLTRRQRRQTTGAFRGSGPPARTAREKIPHQLWLLNPPSLFVTACLGDFLRLFSSLPSLFASGVPPTGPAPSSQGFRADPASVSQRCHYSYAGLEPWFGNCPPQRASTHASQPPWGRKHPPGHAAGICRYTEVKPRELNGHPRVKHRPRTPPGSLAGHA